jgi:hypothetical protein
VHFETTLERITAAHREDLLFRHTDTVQEQVRLSREIEAPPKQGEFGRLSDSFSWSTLCGVDTMLKSTGRDFRLIFVWWINFDSG